MPRYSTSSLACSNPDEGMFRRNALALCRFAESANYRWSPNRNIARSGSSQRGPLFVLSIGITSRAADNTPSERLPEPAQRHRTLLGTLPSKSQIGDKTPMVVGGQVTKNKNRTCALFVKFHERRLQFIGVTNHYGIKLYFQLSCRCLNLAYHATIDSPEDIAAPGDGVSTRRSLPSCFSRAGLTLTAACFWRLRVTVGCARL